MARPLSIQPSRPPVVGAPDEMALPAPVEVSPAEQARLLDLARVAVAVAAGARPQAALRAAITAAPLPERRAAAFVTLTEHGDLRGCMGNLDPDQPMWATVVEAAGTAARHDPRFAAVRPAELPDLDIDVSVLGPLVPLGVPLTLRPMTDGVVIERDDRRGLLLPEVSHMVGGGAVGMLDACCRKAGLAADAWREPGTSIWVFRTHRFSGPAT